MRRWLSRFSRLPVTFNHTHVVRPQQLSPMWITAREPVCEIGKAHQRRRRSSSWCASSAFPIWDVSNGSVEVQRPGDDSGDDEYADQAQPDCLPQSAVLSWRVNQNRANRHTSYESTKVSLPGDEPAPEHGDRDVQPDPCLLYTSPSPRDGLLSRMPSSA